jgi:hypothetical protein
MQTWVMLIQVYAFLINDQVQVQSLGSHDSFPLLLIDVLVFSECTYHTDES